MNILKNPFNFLKSLICGRKKNPTIWIHFPFGGYPVEVSIPCDPENLQCGDILHIGDLKKYVIK